MPRDLAGLAALGTLGYMLANRKKNPDVDTSGVSDMDLTGGARSMTPDTGEIRAEDGTMSKLRRNTETGDLYSPDEPITRPSSSSMSEVKKAVKSGSGMRTMETRVKSKADSDAIKDSISKANSGAMDTGGFEGINKLSKPPTVKVGRASVEKQEPITEKNRITNESLKTAQEKWAKGDQNPPSAFSRFLKDTSGSQRSRPYQKDEMKRGGKVVKMAKGGVTSSASSRADGIATKGRTKGRYI